MALPPVYMKLTLQLSSPQKFKFYNVFYYKPVEGPTWTADPMLDSNTVGDALFAVIIANLPVVLTVATQIVGGAFEMHKDGQVYETSSITGVAGTVDSDEEPDTVAVVIQKRTANPGRSGRGRWFLGPVPEELTDENFLTVAAVTPYESVAHDWLATTAVLGTDWVPQLYTKKNADLVPLTSVYVDEKLGEIRGRKSHSILT